VLPPLRFLVFDGNPLAGETALLGPLNSYIFLDELADMRGAPSGGEVTLDLTTEHSNALHALPLLYERAEKKTSPLLFQLQQVPDHRGTRLHFSIHTQTIPKMLSVKNLCSQFKMGSRTVMRLICRRELRCYRIAHRYRFVVEDIRNYLDHISTH